MRVYGRPGELSCSPPGPDGLGRCTAPGATEIRIEFPEGVSGFRAVRGPVDVGFAPTTFGCRGRDEVPTPAIAGGYGRGGSRRCTDADTGSYADPAGRGRFCPR